MQNILHFKNFALSVPVILFDIAALLFIYFMPAISHLFPVPVYYFEPMRFALVISLLFMNFSNALFIAISLPIFSVLISSHPSWLKAGLISIELVICAVTFRLLYKKFNNGFIAMGAAILISKAVYYALKSLSITGGFISGPLISTPIYMQFFLLVVLSVLAHFIVKRKSVS